MSSQASPVTTPQPSTTPGPEPLPGLSWDMKTDPKHPAYIVTGEDDTPGRKAYYIHVEAKPGKGDDVEKFLRDVHDGVEKEPGTGPWFGVRYSETTFGIFEVFPDAAARHTHDGGPGGTNFLRYELLRDLLAYPAHLYRLNVLFGKYDVLFGKPIDPKE